jgi:hypothetical protein
MLSWQGRSANTPESQVEAQAHKNMIVNFTGIKEEVMNERVFMNLVDRERVT